MVLRALVAFALLAAPGWAGQAPPPDSLAGLVTELEAAGAEGNSAAILALGISPDAPGLRAFAEDFRTAPARFVIKERDRGQLPSGGDRLLLEVFAETNNEAVISTWRADVVDSGAAPGAHRIAELERLTVVNGLYRLSLNPAKQFTVQNLTVEAPDLTLELPKGQAFVAEIAEGPTAVVLLGRGRLRFAPSNAAERTQVRIFGGEETLDAEFDAVLVRVRPAEFEGTFASASLIPSTVVPGDFRRAVGLFDDLIGQSLSLDLTDLSRDRWSLVPSPRDLIVEIRTRRMGQLTYARSTRDPEDISFFDRRRRRNIAVYASEQKLASRGRFYSEDDTADYDVLRYDVDVSFAPHRMWVSGNARVKIRIRAYALTAITLRLAEPLAVRGILSPEYGRLLHLRVVGQNSVIVNFPTSVLRDTELWLHVVYGGRLEPQQIDREGITVAQQQQQVQEQIYIPIEPHYLYSNRSYWYPQSPVTDYATAHLRVTVPPDLDVVATGIQAGPPAPAPGPVEPGERPDKLFVFSADSPVRYLACIISRFEGVVSRSLPAPSPGTGIAAAFNNASGPSDADARQSDDLPVAEPAGQATILTVVANPRQGGRARSLADRAASIMQYYTTLIGDAPYPAFTLAVTEHELPGGHSPGYFALLNQPPALSPLVWRNDPVAFDGYAPYFLAHEIAHQWWGQAVGWKNYHEQWLSEAFAQYFAVLYGSADRGTDLQTSMLRQMRRWAMQESDEGPVYLGYRLGHIRGDSRVFRAVLYNKGAMVLHMLRRLVGDGCFFGGLRVFYRDWRFKKAGTDDFRLAVESVCGGDLSAFFEAWIYGTDVPRLRFSSTVNGSQATVRFEHQGTVMPVPVTVTVLYQDGGSDEVVVPVTERSIERRLPLRGAVRSIEANRDHAAVAEIDR